MITKRLTCLVLGLAILAWGAPPTTAETAPCPDGTGTCDTISLFFHSSARMNETREEKPAHDPNTLFFSWNGSPVVYRSPAYETGMTIANGESVRLVLYRDAVDENDYSTTVTLWYRLNGQRSADPLFTTTVGPVHVEGMGLSAPVTPPATSDAVKAVVDTGTASAAPLLAIGGQHLDELCTLVAPVCPVANRYHTIERMFPGLGDSAGDAGSIADLTAELAWATLFPETSDTLQENWELITLTLPTNVTIPAGAQVEVEYFTTYPGHPVDNMPIGGPNWGAIPRPEIVTYVDRADTPTRLELTLRTA